MIRLRGHFEGTHIVLDEPLPDGVAPQTPVEVSIPEERELALREWQAFSQALWSQPLPPGFQRIGRMWKREDLYERSGRDIS